MDKEVEEIVNKLKSVTGDPVFPPGFPEYKDDRGVIKQISDDIPFNSVLLIESKSETVRANHYHLRDYHVCTVNKGSITYYERPVGSKESPSIYLFEKGDSFFTRPMFEHAMFFNEDTEFWCFSRLSRAQENYESDTVRLDFDLTTIQ